MNTTTGRVISVCLLALAAIGVPSVATAKEKQPKERQYLAHNLWYEHRGDISSALYQSGKMLRAGTEVEKVDVVGHTIYFDVVGGDRDFRVYWVGRHRRGADVRTFFEQLITPKNFQALTRGFTSDEIEAIQAGVIKPGMSKAAVLVAAGIPPESKTPSTEADTWYYWRSRKVGYSVRFVDGKVREVGP